VAWESASREGGVGEFAIRVSAQRAVLHRYDAPRTLPHCFAP
jgi:hypothetical protein